ncbi:tetratricopeptide repeat protein [Sphingomonas sabuli]|uniref:Tetratricopeptide repeat protein n=1 Tax=Sphingomonas sabuli TaxID=2764186 RepID=A0A7G9L1L0_9SPHN|nr:tetratricopeptide repeat protein [Sphingomonas sabuli]QNM82509.1 tetratricopeptide repeat protein [Sphingomonas sabuli]
MALTPDTPNDAFLREVDDNLRRDQMELFAKRYAKWLIAAVVVFLIAAGAYLFWQNQQQKKASQQSEELMAIYDQIGSGQGEQARKRLEPLKTVGNDMVRTLARLADAAVALDSADRNAALANYRAVADDKGAPDAYRNLALVRSTAIEFDQLQPAQVVSRLAPLTKPGNPWFASAGELTAMAYLKQGQTERAGRLFASIASDKAAPLTARSRAVQIAGTLGVDASAALPDLAAQATAVQAQQAAPPQPAAPAPQTAPAGTQQ